MHATLRHVNLWEPQKRVVNAAKRWAAAMRGDGPLTVELATDRLEAAVLRLERLVYQSHDMSSRSLGDLQFLKCGPGCTLEAPPERMPDTSAGLGWRYLLVGEVDLETGAIVDIRKEVTA